MGAAGLSGEETKCAGREREAVLDREGCADMSWSWYGGLKGESVGWLLSMWASSSFKFGVAATGVGGASESSAGSVVGHG